MTANTILEYVHEKINSLPDVAHLAVIFDPRAALHWNELVQLEDEQGRTWSIIHYDGNDIAFRKSQRTERTIVWVTASPDSLEDSLPRITLNSLMDIWGRADLLLDASLVGVIRTQLPNETWPIAPLWEHAEILSQNLSVVQKGLRELRRYLPQLAALDNSSIRALALHCLHPDIPVNAFLFQVDTPSAILQTYLDLLWRCQWDDSGVQLLQKQALQAPHVQNEEILSWLNVTSTQLAQYLYLRRLLGQFHVPNIVNQLRGLGLVDVPVEQLETQVGRLLERWDRDPTWRSKIILQAELAFQEEDIHRVIGLLGLQTIEAILDALPHVETPATLYALQSEFIIKGVSNPNFHKFTPSWTNHPNHLLNQLPDTIFTDRVRLITSILDDIAFIDSRRLLPVLAETDLARLLDWYVAEKLYDLEYAHVRADSNVLRAPESLRVALKKHLNNQKEWIKTFLDTLDHTLAQSIQANWTGYTGHPRLSTNVLWDAVKKRRLVPTEKSRLWVVIFDGMRWDTWVRHVRPRLLQVFELAETEKPYLSLLPSWTMVARTGLLAGKLPGDWKNSASHFSRNQADLAAQLFLIPQNDRSRQMIFYSGMESDRKADQLLSGKRYPYNILIYNISDDNLHSMKGNLVELNKVVDTLLDNIIQSLTNMIEPDDTVVISSDHGFVELSEGDSISIKDDDRWQHQMDGDPNPIHYRYISSNNLSSDLDSQYTKDLCKVSYPGFNDKFTSIIGRKWFRRADARGAEDRYAHGGLSFAEMTVPGAVLKRITQKRIKPEITSEPETLTVLEGETLELAVHVSNKGNIELIGQLTISPEPLGDTVKTPIKLLPGEADHFRIPVLGRYRLLPNRQVESTRAVKIILTYLGMDGKEKSKSHRVSVIVTPRTDKIEIDFGGLDNLDV